MSNKELKEYIKDFEEKDNTAYNFEMLESEIDNLKYEIAAYKKSESENDIAIDSIHYSLQRLNVLTKYMLKIGW